MRLSARSTDTGYAWTSPLIGILLAAIGGSTCEANVALSYKDEPNVQNHSGRDGEGGVNQADIECW
jgi:hypothetical protein